MAAGITLTCESTLLRCTDTDSSLNTAFVVGSKRGFLISLFQPSSSDDRPVHAAGAVEEVPRLRATIVRIPEVVSSTFIRGCTIDKETTITLTRQYRQTSRWPAMLTQCTVNGSIQQ